MLSPTLSNAFEEFKASQDSRMDHIEKVVARSEFPGGGASQIGTQAQQDHEKAFFSFIRKGDVEGLRNLEVKATLRTNSNPDGGYAVPTVIDDEIEKLAVDMAAMRQIAKVKQITTSDYKKARICRRCYLRMGRRRRQQGNN